VWVWTFLTGRRGDRLIITPTPSPPPPRPRRYKPALAAVAPASTSFPAQARDAHPHVSGRACSSPRITYQRSHPGGPTCPAANHRSPPHELRRPQPCGTGCSSLITITYHYLFPQLTMGLVWLIVLWKWMALRTKDERYVKAARLWTRIFGLTFIVGVVTGIPMEFQFGTNWGGFTKYAGGVIGQTLAMEGVFAFLLESAFIGVLLYGEKRLSPRNHFLAAVGLGAGSWLSGYFILVTNAFMQHPVGHGIGEDGRLYPRRLRRVPHESLGLCRVRSQPGGPPWSPGPSRSRPWARTTHWPTSTPAQHASLYVALGRRRRAARVAPRRVPNRRCPGQDGRQAPGGRAGRHGRPV